MNIAEHRQKKGVTQSQLGAAIGVSQTAISMYERGASTPSVPVLARMAEYLGCPMDELARGSKKASPSPPSYQ